MRGMVALCAAALAAFGSLPTTAQVIVAILPVGQPKSCFDITRVPNAKWVEEASLRAEKAFQEYLTAARNKDNLKKLFLTKDNWALDGNFINASDAVDPWIDKIQRIERANLIVSNGGNYVYRAVWNAYTAEGRMLGRYDAWLQSGRGSASFVKLRLYSSDTSADTVPLTPFCNYPGDIQDRQAEEQRRADSKAAKAAASDRLKPSAHKVIE